jgi:hypothetical protein
MTKQECDLLIEEYLSWLRKGLSATEVHGTCELTTPFLDRHNDHLQVYAVRDDGKIRLTDDGYILAELDASGVALSTPKRKAVLDGFLRGFGVRRTDDALTVDASPNNIGQRIHSLIQAMLAVNDMFILAQPRVATLFLEDVREFLDGHDVRYSERIKLPGRTGFDHAIDFLVPKSRRAPERFVKAINSPNKNTVSNYLFAVNDIRESRPSESRAYAILNDRERKPGGDVVSALEEYDVISTLWSERETLADELAA